MSKFPLFVLATAFVLALLPQSSHAQETPIDRGCRLITGGLVFSSSGGDLYAGADSSRHNQTTISGSGNYFLLHGLAVGAKMSLRRDAIQGHSSTTFGVGPSLSYFVGWLQPKIVMEGAIYPFISIAYLFRRSSTKTEWAGQSSSSSDSTTGLGLGLGICYMLTDTACLIVEANYEKDKSKSDAGALQTGNRIRIALGLGAFGY